MITPKKGTRILARRADEVRRYRILRKVIPAVMAVIAVFLAMIYTVSVMYSKFGSFTISVQKFQSLKYGLSLAETSTFDKPSVVLNCRAAEEITNIDGAVLDDLPLGAVDGNDSKDDYLCYTFYCKNTGEEQVNFIESINISNMTMGIEEAVRIRVITTDTDGSISRVDYARATTDADGNRVPEPGTENFYNAATVMQREVKDFKPGDVRKYTVVIWLEGPDPDCVDSVIGGVFKIDMKFNVSSHGGIPV